MTNREKPLAVFLWAWVALALGAYLFQFRDMINPVLDLLGLA